MRLLRDPFRLLDAVAAAAIILLVVVICVDVGGRFFFNAPFAGALEVMDVLVCLAIFPALPRLCAKRLNINVDLIDNALSDRLRRALLVTVDAVCAACLLVVAYRMSVYAGRLMEYGDETMMLRIPIYPFMYLIAAMALLGALACLAAPFCASEQGEAQP